MPNEDNKTLKYNCGEKSLKAPFFIPFDVEFLLPKVTSSQNKPEKSCTERKAKHVLSGYAFPVDTRRRFNVYKTSVTSYRCLIDVETVLCVYWVNLICSFDTTKNKRDFGRGEDSIEGLFKKFKYYVMKIINYEEKEMIPLTDEENKSYEKQKVCHICKKKFCIDENEKSEFELYHEVRDHCHYTRKFRGAAHNICNLRYKTPKEIPVVAHNAAYDHNFVIL